MTETTYALEVWDGIIGGWVVLNDEYRSASEAQSDIVNYNTIERYRIVTTTYEEV